MPPETPSPGRPGDWLRHARSDLTIAGQQRVPDVLLETLCFHAQQAAEKSFKAVLVWKGFRAVRVARGVLEWAENMLR